MQSELVAVREASIAASNQLSEAITTSNEDTAALLRGIRDLLTANADAPESEESE